MFNIIRCSIKSKNKTDVTLQFEMKIVTVQSSVLFTTLALDGGQFLFRTSLYPGHSGWEAGADYMNK
jgi:hypothetical protein